MKTCIFERIHFDLLSNPYEEIEECSLIEFIELQTLYQETHKLKHQWPSNFVTESYQTGQGVITQSPTLHTVKQTCFPLSNERLSLGFTSLFEQYRLGKLQICTILDSTGN